MKLQFGETLEYKNCTIHRAFGEVIFALSDNVDRQGLIEDIFGCVGDDYIDLEHCTQIFIEPTKLVDPDKEFIWIDGRRLEYPGCLTLHVNERSIADNDDNRYSFERVIDEIIKHIDYHSGTEQKTL